MKNVKWKALLLAGVLAFSGAIPAAVSAEETEAASAESTPYMLRTEQAEQYVNNKTKVWLELDRANSENIASYQVSLQLVDEQGQAMTGTSMSLTFDEALENTVVKEAKYDETTGIMEIYVAGTENLVQIGEDAHILPIGTIRVTSPEDPAENRAKSPYKIVISGSAGDLMTVGTDHSMKDALEIYGKDNPEYEIPSDGIIYGMPVEYPLEIQTANGTVKAYVDDTEVKNKAKVEENQKVRLSATPDKGYRLSDIYLKNKLDASQERIEVPGSFTFEMTGEIVVVAEFEKLEENFKVTVEGGRILNGSGEEDQAEFPSREVARISPTVPEGKKFSHWTNEEGATVSYDANYAFVVTNDVKLTANFADAAEDIQEEPMVVMEPVGTVTKIGSTYRLSYTGKVSVPEGYRIVKRGMVLINKTAGLDENTFVLGGTISGTKVADMAGPAFVNEQYIMNVNSVKPNQTRVGRMYLTYESENGEQETIYSSNWVALTTPAN